jgi:hypothetical protein
MSHNLNERRFYSVGDLPGPLQSKLYFRLQRVAMGAARGFAGRDSERHQHCAGDVASKVFVQLCRYRRATPLGLAELALWAERIVRKQCRRELARYEKRCRRLLPLDVLTDSHDEASQVQEEFARLGLANSWPEFEQLLLSLGMHPDWARFAWHAANEKLPWSEMMERYALALCADIVVLRKRWSRLMEALRPAMLARWRGESTAGLELPPNHWAAQPMRPAGRRRQEALPARMSRRVV